MENGFRATFGSAPVRGGRRLRFACIVGARPNFVKMAPILAELERHAGVAVTLIHTGQHHHPQLSDAFVRSLGMRGPDVRLAIGGQNRDHRRVRAREQLERVFATGPIDGGDFDRIVVVGDVDSTVAAALAAARLGIPIDHVEAGLRSFDRGMPEEANRQITDAVSDRLLVSEPSGLENLRREGHRADAMHLVGNVMIDTLIRLLPRARALETLAELRLQAGGYAVVTLHRPSNVDDGAKLGPIVEALLTASRLLPLVFPVHPRTRRRLDACALGARIEAAPGVRVVPPLEYLPFLCLTSQARMILTDSGGLQEESTALGIPCLTLRSNTERPITVTEGTSTLVGDDPRRLSRLMTDVLQGRYKRGRCPALWDGAAADRIVRILIR